jgi:hypothetical protein
MIDVAVARTSRVITSPLLLNMKDIDAIFSVRRSIYSKESVLENNPQNATHEHKSCCFLNNPPTFAICKEAADVVSKLLSFAHDAWKDADWGGNDKSPGPLYNVKGGMSSLSIRVVELWQYEVSHHSKCNHVIDSYFYLVYICRWEEVYQTLFIMMRTLLLR